MILHKNNQTHITPDLAIQLLKDGNERFCNNMSINRNHLQHVTETVMQQTPFAAILSCMDSRTPAELILDQGIGDIFSIRVAGNVISENVLGSLEYAVAIAAAKLIVVMGHTHCGAVKGACDQIKLGKLTSLLGQIQEAVALEKTILEHRNGNNPAFVHKVSVMNVYLSIDQMLHQSAVIQNAFETSQIKIVPALYDIASGKVDFLGYEAQVHPDLQRYA
jgi:carbonic anhydrase